MQASQVPAKFPITWAANASVSYIRTIPESTADPVAASLSLGFPPATAVPVTSGGTPPDIRDANGGLSQLSAWAQWQSAGGPIAYDSGFSASIGGYPKGAMIMKAGTPGSYWFSTVDNNTSDPDTGGANWLGATLTGLGTAAYKAASSNSQATLASISGGVTAGHVAIFADINGTISDGGVFGPFGTASAKNTTNNAYASVSAFTGSSVIGQFPSFSDGNGSLQNSGYSVSASVGAAFLATTSWVNTTYAPLASPALTGTPTAPTATGGTNTTQIATTAFVASAIAPLAPLNSPALTGTPTAPTQVGSDNTTKIATTAFVQGAVSGLAPLASPGLTGTPTAPTALAGTNTTQLATTAFVVTALAPYAPLNSPALTGAPTAPTQAPGTNNTTIANTAFVQAAIGFTTRYANVNVVFSSQSFKIATFTWNTPFPTACLAFSAVAQTNDSFNPNTNGNNFAVIVYGVSASGGTIRVDTEQGGNATGTCPVSIIGIGN